MADEQMTLASAVIVPEPQEVPDVSPPPASTKRRQSSVSEAEPKRPRLSTDANDVQRNGHDDRTPTDTTDRERNRRQSGQVEDRKRGKRLFGALLGTLSQGSSSSTTAQRRRADIEKKQQAKLKLQAEEYDEKKRQDLDLLMERRRKEQKKFDEETMRIRHSNTLMMANFLHTSAEPSLYYKPWELLPEEEERIKQQLTEAESAVEKEDEAFSTSRQQEIEKTTNGAAVELSNGTTENALPAKELTEEHTVGTGSEEARVSKLDEPTNSEPTIDPNAIDAHKPPLKDPPDDGDNGDGGEVVLEADEDTVIY
ncbi:MAG: hypothetical protein M4579_001356 [Chaenotheca gracillima]|nr:MAG: hypothetical protein M4579_001356 [Chaenotheca gracillima]